MKEQDATHTGDNWRIAYQAGGNETAFFSIVADVVPPGAPSEIRVMAECYDLTTARLIAAAPELLVALERLVAEYGESHPLKQWQEARIAINKAKGGGNSLASPSESEE